MAPPRPRGACRTGTVRAWITRRTARRRARWIAGRPSRGRGAGVADRSVNSDTDLVLIRRERPSDVRAVHDVVAAAFAGPEASGPRPVEVGLLARLRADAAWLPALSLVAVASGEGGRDDGAIAGHVVCTRGAVDGTPALGLGPVAVQPARQGRGVGTALMHAVLSAADALDEPLVAVLGEPDYYRRFGFGPSTRYAIVPPDPRWGEYFQVRPLSGYRGLGGAFTYAEPFIDV